MSEIDKEFKTRLFDQLTSIEEKVDLVHEGVYGSKNYEGIKKIVERHEKLLAFFNWYYGKLFRGKAVQGTLLLIALFHTLAYSSFKGIDKLISLLP